MRILDTQRLVHVGIGEAHVSTDENEVLITHSLGSCLGVSVFDPVAKVGGLLHCQLPLSSAMAERAAERPFMFADTGLVELLHMMFDLGAQKNRVVVKVAGGASALGHGDIGASNWKSFQLIAKKNGIAIAGSQVGGAIPRTMTLSMLDGTTTVRSPEGEKVL